MANDTPSMYSPETLISVHTGRPLAEQAPNLIDTTAKFHKTNFWCGVCEMKLRDALTALSHLRGRSHKRKVNPVPEINALKRKLEDDVAQNGIHDGTQIKKSRRTTTMENETLDVELLECEICERVFQTASASLQHFKGKMHVKKLEADLRSKFLVDMKCEDCDTEFTAIAMAIQHFKGRKHVAKMLQLERTVIGEVGGVKVELTGDPAAPGAIEGELKCELCDCVFTSEINAVQHFSGKKHNSKVAAASGKTGNGLGNGCVGDTTTLQFSEDITGGNEWMTGYN